MTYNLTDGAQTVSGLKTFNDGVRFATSGGTASILNDYEEYTTTATWQGIWATNQTSSLKLTRAGKNISLHIQGVLATANTAAVITGVGVIIPTRFLNTNESPWGDYVRSPIIIRNNNADASGAIQIFGNGGVTISASVGVGNFAGSGSSGFAHINIGWSL